MVFAWVFCQCFFNIPPKYIYPMTYGFGFDSNLSSPISKNHCSTVMRYVPIISFVCSLFIARYPLAIAGFIVSIDIYSFNRMVITWSCPQVAVKSLKRMNPSIANSYSTPSIKWVSAFLRVVASSFHATPNFVLRRVGHAVSRCSFLCDFGEKTSAGFRSATSQVFALNDYGIPAFAQTRPARDFFSKSASLFNCGKSSKFQARKINKIMCIHARYSTRNCMNWNPLL